MVALCNVLPWWGNAMQRLALIALASIPCLMSEADASTLQDTIATDLSFIEQQVTKTLDSLGSVPAANPLYPYTGGDSGTWTTTSPSNVAQGWTTGFFRASFGSCIRRPGRRSGLMRRRPG